MVGRVGEDEIEVFVRIAPVPCGAVGFDKFDPIAEPKRFDVGADDLLRPPVALDSESRAGTSADRLKTERAAAGKRVKHALRSYVAKDIKERAANALAHWMSDNTFWRFKEPSAQLASD